ncbi:MAG: hypothetical protein RMI91_02030 [Gemmatales bacterium]|nr:hypothetical protein [Gemmatales bacterium]MDW7993405.1 hypothetical protein [Gemmatales bacterium]
MNVEWTGLVAELILDSGAEYRANGPETAQGDESKGNASLAR